MEVAKDISVPKHSTLYHYRVDLDLASMLWARKYRFGLEAKWVAHCRIDSSPQFGRDFLMGECDIVYLAGVGSWMDIGKEGVLYTRLLVGQMVGARASGSMVKPRKLLHALSLESRLLFNIGLTSFCFVAFDTPISTWAWIKIGCLNNWIVNTIRIDYVCGHPGLEF